MPRYDFECKKCEAIYEEIVGYDQTGKYPSVKCPYCGSKSKKKLMNSCNFNFSNPEGTDRWNSEATGHDYRFQHKQKDVRAEREAAQAHHGEGSPYNAIDDLNNNDAWGDVK